MDNKILIRNLQEALKEIENYNLVWLNINPQDLHSSIETAKHLIEKTIMDLEKKTLR